MAVLTKSIEDIVALWERTDHVHLYPPFSIEWAMKKPGEDKALLGIIRSVEGSATGLYIYEVWEVGT